MDDAETAGFLRRLVILTAFPSDGGRTPARLSFPEGRGQIPPSPCPRELSPPGRGLCSARSAPVENEERRFLQSFVWETIGNLGGPSGLERGIREIFVKRHGIYPDGVASMRLGRPQDRVITGQMECRPVRYLVGHSDSIVNTESAKYAGLFRGSAGVVRGGLSPRGVPARLDLSGGSGKDCTKRVISLFPQIRPEAQQFPPPSAEPVGRC